MIRQLHQEIAELRSKAGQYDALQCEYSNLEAQYARDARANTTRTQHFKSRIEETCDNSYTLQLTLDKLKSQINQM